MFQNFRSGTLEDVRQLTAAVKRAATERPAATFDEYAARLPHDTAVVAFALLDSELHAVVLRSGSVHERSVAVDRLYLETAVGRFVRALESDDPAYFNFGEEIGRLVWAPIAEEVRGASTIVVVPDGILSIVPFSAIVAPHDTEPLIAHSAIVISPSLGTYFAQSRLLNAAAGPHPLVVAPDYSATPWNILPRALDEARTIARLLPGSELLAGPGATVERFAARLGSAGIIHFAGHSVANSRLPHLSYLALAPSSESPSGAFTGTAVAASHLPLARLVVLSSCRSGGSAYSRSEGPLGLAGSFAAAGVPAVVATSWPVDDAAAADVQTEFYRRLMLGERVSAALRHAQLQMRRTAPARPSAWAAWLAMGSDQILYGGKA